MPLGTAGIAAADMRDIAEAAAISLTEEGHEEQTYDIVGLRLSVVRAMRHSGANCSAKRSSTQGTTSTNGNRVCVHACRAGAPSICA